MSNTRTDASGRARVPASRTGVPTVPSGPAIGPRLGPASAAPAAPVKRKRGRPRKSAA